MTLPQGYMPVVQSFAVILRIEGRDNGWAALRLLETMPEIRRPSVRADAGCHKIVQIDSPAIYLSDLVTAVFVREKSAKSFLEPPRVA